MTQQEIQEYYSDLLIRQYRGKTKAVSTVQALVNCNLCDGLVQELQTCFNLDTAFGNQLTIIGSLVGVPRNVYGLDLGHTFFTLARYTGTPTGVGLKRYVDAADLYLFLRYANNATYTLTDAELRTIIKIKIGYNNQQSSFYDIKTLLYSVTAGGIDILDDWESSIMHVTFNVAVEYENIYLVMAYLNILPIPMGVGFAANLA